MSNVIVLDSIAPPFSFYSGPAHYPQYMYQLPRTPLNRCRIRSIRTLDRTLS